MRCWAGRASAVVALGVTLVAGCAGSIHRVPIQLPDQTAPLAGARALSDLKACDNVVVTKRSGKQYGYSIVELTQDGFVGRQHDKTYTIRYADLTRLEVERTAWPLIGLK